jgi:hypothetical protein
VFSETEIVSENICKYRKITLPTCPHVKNVTTIVTFVSKYITLSERKQTISRVFVSCYWFAPWEGAGAYHYRDSAEFKNKLMGIMV